MPGRPDRDERAADQPRPAVTIPSPSSANSAVTVEYVEDPHGGNERTIGGRLIRHRPSTPDSRVCVVESAGAGRSGTGGWVGVLPGRRASQPNERKIMKILKRTPAIAAALAAVALAAAGCSSSGSSSSAGGGSSSGASGGTVDIYSSLPLQGASTSADRSAGQRHQARALSGRRQGRAVDGELPVARRLDRGGRQVGPGPDGSQRAQGSYRPEGRLLHRRVQLGRQRGVDPDPQPGRDSPR